MKRWLMGTAGLALALSSLAVAQDSPESLLPPGFDKPKPAARPPATPGDGSTPVVQPLPGGSSGGSAGGRTSAIRPATLPSGARVPSLKELESMSPDELDQLLGLKPKFDMPSALRRSMKQVGILAEDEGGMPPGSLGRQNAALVGALLGGNKGRLVSRWGHILLRRVLASRLDAPAGMNPADFAGARAALLVRMGEGDAARQMVQDVDAGNYTPALTQAAIDAYQFTGDITGICTVVSVIGGGRKDADWRVLQAICSSFEGSGASAMAQLDRLVGQGGWQQLDVLLAKRYAGAAGKARQTVKIEWEGVQEMTPWRYALSMAVGAAPPAALLNDLPVRYDYVAATAPMAPLVARAKGADRAGAAGILSSAAMVDLYSQIYSQDDINGRFAESADTLRIAYVGETPEARMQAIRALWDGGTDAEARYSRQVLTAFAAARVTPSGDHDAVLPDLIAAMLSAGLDQNALRWAPHADLGTVGWGQLVLAAPNRTAPVEGGALDSFYDGDASEGHRKSRFLLAGLAALGRVEANTAGGFADKLGIDLGRQTRWTRLIDQAADVNNRALVVLLAGIGMQGDSWAKMTSVNLYHIISALDRVGLSAEARMIAAEAVARS